MNLKHPNLFDTLAELSPIGIFVADSDGVCSYVNKRWCEISEQSADHAIGKVWYDVVHPSDRSRVLANWNKCKEKQSEFELEYRFLTKKTQSIVWIHCRALPIKNQSLDRIDFYIGTVADTTVHRTLTEELENSRKFLDSVIENIPNMLFVKEANELKFVRFNRAGEELLGIKRQDLLGKKDFDLFPKQQAENFTNQDRSVLKSKGLLITEEELIKTKANGQRWVRTKKIPILDELGDARYILGISEDITDTKLANETQRSALKLAEESNTMKTQFLANMSHEIRTPINGILGLAELVLDGNLSREQREYLSTLRLSAEALLRVVNDVLDYSKIEADAVEIIKTPFSVQETLSEVSSLFQRSFQEKEIQYHVCYDQKIPKQIVGDQFRIRQILTNLLSNAIKFTSPRGSIKLSADLISYNDQNRQIEFSVEDTGIGISPDKLELIFKPFAQADTSITRNFGGTGLGLTICRELTELMGGRISAASAPGKGARFSITLPCEEPSSDSQTTQSKPLAQQNYASKQPRLKGHSILLAEDNPVNQVVARNTLEKLGYKVTVATNGEEALSKLKNTDFDLVLMDIQMPVMDGMSAVIEIRKREAEQNRCKVPVIAMTAHALEGDKEKFLAAGMDDYISKPFKRTELLNLIVKLTEGKVLKPESVG